MRLLGLYIVSVLINILIVFKRQIKSVWNILLIIFFMIAVPIAVLLMLFNLWEPGNEDERE